jgi:hypothetical protein
VASRRLTTVAAITVVAIAGVVVVLLLGRSVPSTTEGAAPGLIHAQARLVPAAVQFGDPVTAQVTATVDASRIDPHTVRITQSLAPLTELGASSVRVLREGKLGVVVQTTRAACLTDACVGSSNSRTVSLPPARVTAASSGGSSRTVTAAWPALTVQGRVTASAVSSSVTALRADASPPSVSYRISPTTLARLLDAAAVFLVVLAVIVGGREVARLVAGRRPPVDPLTYALGVVRDAEGRPAPERRVALDLLSRVLGRRGEARAVQDTAWSEPEPSTADMSALVEEIERDRETSR